MRTLYRFLASVAGAGAFPFLWLRSRAGGGEWKERLALSLPALSSEGPAPLWCHAASVGEMESLLPLLEELRARHREIPLAVSATTVTGRDLCRRRGGSPTSFLLPLDVPWLVRKVLERLSPRAIVLAETELWPALISECSRRRIPLALVNGRISRRGFDRYRRVRNLTREVLAPFRLLAMQSEEDRERIISLGARPEVTEVTGNAKADALASPSSLLGRSGLRERWGIAPGVRLLVAGSVRPEEVSPVLEAFLKARESFPALRLLLAPRHMDRVAEVERETARRGLLCRRRSAGLPGEGESAPADWEVLLLDTMGELAEAYLLGEVAFVGGTLDPRYGGHNPLEPALRGVPVLLGPHYRNCAVAAERLLSAGGARLVADAGGLARELVDWLGDPEGRGAAGEAAARGAAALGGVAARTVDLLERRVLGS